MSVLIYVEGGSQGSSKTACRQAFRSFFEKIIPNRTFQVIASGNRVKAFEDFCLALKQHRQDYVILLIDSEEAVVAAPWRHLAARRGDRWHRPAGAADDQAHLMVQVMESWFIADQQVLIGYYGRDFLANSLPRQPDVELISKRDVLNALRHASRNTQKGEYHKTRHAFDLLEQIDPKRVRIASRHADRLFTVLARETAR